MAERSAATPVAALAGCGPRHAHPSTRKEPLTREKRRRSLHLPQRLRGISWPKEGNHQPCVFVRFPAVVVAPRAFARRGPSSFIRLQPGLVCRLVLAPLARTHGRVMGKEKTLLRGSRLIGSAGTTMTPRPSKDPWCAVTNRLTGASREPRKMLPPIPERSMGPVRAARCAADNAT